MISIVECCICNRMTKANLLLGDTNICRECEEKIMKLDKYDADYLLIKKGIKRIYHSDNGDLS